MKFQAVIFDLDGTLLDTIDDLANSMNSVLSRKGFPIHDREAHKHFVGDGLRVLVRRSLPEGMRNDSEIDACLSLLKEEYGRRWDECTRPYDGIPELLVALKQRGLKTAVLSNKVDSFTKLIVEKFLPDAGFEVIYGERPTVPKKPNPTGAVEISEIFGIPTDRFLYIGDTDIDMKTAVSAGMYAVGAMWGFREARELADGGAKVIIPKPGALLDLL